MVQIFVSYSHRDSLYLGKNELIEKLQKELKNKARFWYDRSIRAGENWNEEIQTNILNSQIAILLVSKNFMNSTYITNKEVEKFLTVTVQKFEIIPVMISKCRWKKIKWLSETQQIPGGGRSIESDFKTKPKREAIYKQIVAEVDQAIAYVKKPEIKTGKAISSLINLFNTIEAELLKACNKQELIGNNHRLMFEGHLKNILVKEKRGMETFEKIRPVKFDELYKNLNRTELKAVRETDNSLSIKYKKWYALDVKSLRAKSNKDYQSIERKKQQLIRTMFADLMTMLILIHKAGLSLDDHYISIYQAMNVLNKPRSMYFSRFRFN